MLGHARRVKATIDGCLFQRELVDAAGLLQWQRSTSTQTVA
jgi:hypothetical protein